MRIVHSSGFYDNSSLKKERAWRIIGERPPMTVSRVLELKWLNNLSAKGGPNA